MLLRLDAEKSAWLYHQTNSITRHASSFLSLTCSISYMIEEEDNDRLFLYVIIVGPIRLHSNRKARYALF